MIEDIRIKEKPKDIQQPQEEKIEGLSSNPYFNQYSLDAKKKATCQIMINSSFKGTGFFVNLPIKGEKIKALISNEHVIEKKMINGLMPRTIEIIPYGGYSFFIRLKEEGERKIYSISRYAEDVTIIKLLPREGPSSNFFLEVDEEFQALEKKKKKKKVEPKKGRPLKY